MRTHRQTEQHIEPGQKIDLGVRSVTLVEDRGDKLLVHIVKVLGEQLDIIDPKAIERFHPGQTWKNPDGDPGGGTPVEYRDEIPVTWKIRLGRWRQVQIMRNGDGGLIARVIAPV